MVKKGYKINFIAAALAASLLLPGGTYASPAAIAGELAESSSATAASQALLQSRLQQGLAPSGSALAPSLARGLATADTTPALISPSLDTKSSARVKVILQLEGAAVAEAEFAARQGLAPAAAVTPSEVDAEQEALLAAARQRGLSLQVTYRYDTVLNGMEVELPANQIPLLALLPGVKSIHENLTYSAIPAETVSPTALSSECKCDIDPLKQLGVPEAWAAGLTGRGLKVGVIDTGVDYLHPDLAGAYKGGHDSYFNTDDPYEEIPNAATGNPGTSHGTHVSGTIVGRAAADSDVVQKGVAYEAELHAYKVLGYNAETGRSSGSSAQVIDGIERAVKDGMDVINLSLGADEVKDPFSPDAIAVNNAVLAGVIAVVANGNAADEGRYYYSMGSPASSQLAISVGAASSPSSHYAATVSATVYSRTVTDVAYGGLDYGLSAMGWRTGAEDFASIIGTEPVEAVYAGLGAESDYEGLDAAGKIVLVSRGSLAFVDKAAIAKEHGAKALIIFNGLNAGAAANLSESIPGRDGFIGPVGFFGDSFRYLPTFDMEGAPGRELARIVLAHPEAAFTLQFGADYPLTVEPGDRMASFSSRGPASDGKLGIKPDVTAPGVNILSTWPAYGKANPDASYDEAYNRISGTSMASPHTAGLALLLRQQHPEWTPMDIRAALANTADAIFDETGTLYDVYSQGGGRANIAQAIRTPAVLQTVEPLQLLDGDLHPLDVTNFGSSYSFGVVPAGAAAPSAQLRVKNTSGSAVTYAASVELHPSVTSDPANPIETPDVSKLTVSLDGLSGGGVTAPAGGAASFSLTASVADDAAEGAYEGSVVLTAPGLPTLRLPFALHVGDRLPDNGFGIQDLTLSSPILSPDGDGVNDTIDASFTLHADGVNLIDLEVYDVNDDYIGMLFLADAGIGSSFPAGRYTVSGLDEMYYDSYDEDGLPIYKKLPEGTYTLYVVATEINANRQLVNQYFTTRSMAVAYNKTELGLVANAKEAFQANIVNTTAVGKPVLELPVRQGVTYAVTGSDRPQLIAADGVLAARPKTDDTVTLTVTIASAAVPTIRDTVQVPVALKGVPAELGERALKGVLRPSQTKLQLKSSVSADGLVTVTDADIAAALKGAKKPLALIVGGSWLEDGGAVRLSLSASQAAALAKAPLGSSIALNAGRAAAELPLYLLASLPKGAGAELAIRDAADQAAAFAAARPGTTLLGSPVAFELGSVASAGAAPKPLPIPASAFVRHAFVLDAGSDASKAGALYRYGSQALPAPSTFAANADGTTTVTVSHPGYAVYAAAKRTAAFTDIGGSPYKASIQRLADKLLIDGTSETKFSPKTRLTLAQFDDLISRAFGLPPVDGDTFAGSVSANGAGAAFSPLNADARAIASGSGLLGGGAAAAGSSLGGLAGKWYTSVPIISREAAAGVIEQLLLAAKLI
ncbi:alkaline serine protease [Paenibacillus pasadenensis]|uniref:Alkaline serine protease n=1 Tax=Paenibacillus pasadenensis TaxID=217090 RepID=A0A2N5N123_9BACL|nr:S8 family serine peptidase [Paenibacillus pasadenensis]PLT44037.1 alkaline serine protease [Paenibacillus pasadenensis]